MSHDEVRYVRPGDPDVTVERHRLNQAGGGSGGGGASGGAGGGGSGSGGSGSGSSGGSGGSGSGGGGASGGGSSGGGGGSNATFSPSESDAEGASFSNQGQSQQRQGQGQGQQNRQSPQSNQRSQPQSMRLQGPRPQGQQEQQGQEQQPQEQQSPSQPQSQSPSYGSSSQKESPMSNQCPPYVIAGAAPYAPYAPFSPYAAPYAAPYGAAPAGGGPVTVVTGAGDGHRSNSAQLETLSDIALGGLRESAATGRTNQLSTQIAQLGDRLGMESGFSRELTSQRQFTEATKERGDLENRLLTAIKDESIRTREMFVNERINSLTAENTSLRESRRFQELDRDLTEIKRLLRDREAAR